MAQGIQDIGNGLGLLYVTDLSGTIIGTDINNTAGVRRMRSIGAACAPIAASRPAVGTVRFSSVGGAGNITGITIAAVNQIGANVAATVGDPLTTAFDVADAINSFNPGSGPNYTAQAVGDTVFIFSPPADGVTVNGQAITVSVSNVLITTVISPMANGANSQGAKDSVVGLQFALNANYTNPVVPTSLLGAIDITAHMVVRGTQSGTPQVLGSINNDRIDVVNRYANVQEIQIFNQGGAATDYLAYINPAEFNVADSIRLRSYDLAQVATVIDASDPVSPVLQRNIYLCNQAPFDLASNRSITLTLVYDSSLGLIWVEDVRAFSSSSSIITTTRVALLATLSAGLSTAGQQYLVTDIFGCTGVVCEAISASQIKLSCDIIAQVPDYQDTSGNFGGVWYPQLAAATINKWYVYDGVMYINTTGAVSVGVEPPLNAVNWSPIPLSSGFYITEIHYGEIDLANDCITLRRDKRNNVTKTAYPQLGFQYQHTLMAWGNDKVYNNELSFTTAFILNNFAGALCFGNKITENASCFYSGGNYFYGTPLGWFFNNEIKQATITEVYSDLITNNKFGNNSTVTDIGNFASSTNFVLDECVFGPQSNFYVNSGTFLVTNVESLTMNKGTAIQLNAGVGAQILINGVTLTPGSSFNLNVDGFSFMQNTIVDGYGVIQNINLSSASLAGLTIINPPYCNFSVNGTQLANFTIDKVFFNTGAITVNHGKRIYDTLDLDDPAIYSGTTLTLPAGYSGTGGTFLLTSSSPTITIDRINNLFAAPFPGLQPPFIAYDNLAIWRFIANDGLTVTFASTPILTVTTAGQYISDSATDVIVGRDLGGAPIQIDTCDYLEVYGVGLSPGFCVRKNVLNTLV